MSSDLGIVEKSGSWFSYNGNRIGQGRDAVKAFLKENPALCDELDKKVRALIASNAKAKVEEAAAKSAAISAKVNAGFEASAAAAVAAAVPEAPAVEEKPKAGKK
jgi:recombination protein RecA